MVTTEENLQKIYDAIIDMLADIVEPAVEEEVAKGTDVQVILDDGLIRGMTEVGIRFAAGDVFVPEVLMSATEMKKGMEVIRPILAETGAPPRGTVVAGTVKGDVHDIGKNLWSMMMEGAGYKIVNIGVRNTVEDFFAAMEENKADILGMSAMLTTTMPYMKVVIDAMIEQGIRDNHIVLVGGAPLTENFAREIGADAYCEDGVTGVQMANELIDARGKASGDAAASAAGE
jgi:5-methyltetrahydrofolate--homocysteine methyltransferase